MPLYLTLSRGPRADLAKPVLASSDPRVVNAALEAIHRLGDASDDEDAAAVNSVVGELGWRVLSRGTDPLDGGPR
jgi:hypothetical protein